MAGTGRRREKALSPASAGAGSTLHSLISSGISLSLGRGFWRQDCLSLLGVGILVLPCTCCVSSGRFLSFLGLASVFSSVKWGYFHS